MVQSKGLFRVIDSLGAISLSQLFPFAQCGMVDATRIHVAKHSGAVVMIPQILYLEVVKVFLGEN